MDAVTRKMIKIYELEKYKLDFMSYRFNHIGDLTYHHLIIPKCNGGKKTIKNGAILTDTSHQYLHLIQQRDEEIFSLISSEMIDQNIKGRLDIKNLKKIRELLRYFESEHIDERTREGKLLIKEKYLIRPKLDTF